MRILGIDPGVAIVGFGLIESERGAVRMLQYGAVNTSAGLPLATRLVQIEQDLTQLIQQFKPDEIAIEELFFSKNITTGIAVAHGRGVILCIGYVGARVGVRGMAPIDAGKCSDSRCAGGFRGLVVGDVGAYAGRHHRRRSCVVA